MRKLAALCLAAFALPLLADTYPRPVGFAVTHYEFAVTLSDASNSITMHEIVVVRLTQDGVSEVALDLCQLRTQPGPASQTVEQVRSNPCLVSPAYGMRGAPAALPSTVGRGMLVTAATASGTAAAFHQADDRVTIALPQPARAGQEVTLTLDYHGTPANGLYIANNKYGDREFFTNEWPDRARNWLAVVDHPSMKATKLMTVVAPDKYQVISNGLKTESTDLPGGLRRTVWHENTPICTWQFSLGAAPMAVDYFGNFHGIPLSAWVYPQEREASFKAFSDYTQPILEFYVDHIGPFSYEKLAQVEANGVGGGMELASDIFYGYAPSGPGRQLIAHEMAHQWFGDSVTEKDWDDVWLSEGFATYFALLYTEHQDGHDAFLRGVQSSAAQAIRYAEAHPASTVVHNNLSNISQVIANNAQIYQEGAQVLQMLRGVLGTDTFWNGIRLYYHRFQNHNANSLDFQHAMEDACRAADLDNATVCPSYGQNLSWFFDEWLHRGGTLHVTGTWRYDASRKAVIVDLTQPAVNGAYYQMPFPVAVTEPALPPAPRAARSGRGGRGAGRG
ncbi:MAG: M1 family metallopeptidase, partial [Terriglobales bacterium]